MFRFVLELTFALSIFSAIVLEINLIYNCTFLNLTKFRYRAFGGMESVFFDDSPNRLYCYSIVINFGDVILYLVLNFLNEDVSSIGM